MQSERVNDVSNKSAPQKRLKVLLSVYSCQPGKGSEPGVGWAMVQQTSRFHDVWALTSAENAVQIEPYLRENPMPNVHFIYPKMPFWMPSWRKAYKLIRVHYYIWQIMAYRTIQRDYKDVPFDAVHHLTFVSYWTPSFLSRLSAPFVWGPVGGAESAPQSFYPSFDSRSRLNERLRDTIRWLAHTFDPFVRMTARRARVAFATTQESAAKMRALGAKDVRTLGESGLAPSEIDFLGNLPMLQTSKPVRFISMGRLISWKAYHLGLQAFARFQQQNPESEYWVVGDGAELENLKRLAVELSIQEKVHFTGKVPREEAMQKLADAHALVHPSLHDSGGWVCLEAMAAGRPVICLNLGGPATQVTPETGFIVPAPNPEQAVENLAKAMQALANDDAKRLKMGESGRSRVSELYNWDRKGEFYSSLYESLSSKSEKGLR